MNPQPLPEVERALAREGKKRIHHKEAAKAASAAMEPLIIELADAGYVRRSIAKIAGVNESWVYGILSKAGRTRTPGYRPDGTE